MPRSVRRFASLWWASFLIAIVGLPPTYVVSWTRAAVMRQLVVTAAAALAFLIVFFPVFWFAVYRRRNWARWVLLLLFVASVPFGIFNNMTRVPFPLANIGVGLVSGLVEVAAFYFLFSEDAAPWFRADDSR